MCLMLFWYVIYILLYVQLYLMLFEDMKYKRDCINEFTNFYVVRRYSKMLNAFGRYVKLICIGLTLTNSRWLFLHEYVS